MLKLISASILDNTKYHIVGNFHGVLLNFCYFHGSFASHENFHS